MLGHCDFGVVRGVFAATAYPKRTLIIPSLKLKEVRNTFPRSLDDGCEIDCGCALLSAQLDSVQKVRDSMLGNTMGSAAWTSGVFNVNSDTKVKY